MRAFGPCGPLRPQEPSLPPLRPTGAPQTPEDLRNHLSLFMMRTGVAPVWQLRHSIKAKEVVMPLTPRLLSDDMIGLKQAAIAGLGVVALPGYVCREEVRSEY